MRATLTITATLIGLTAAAGITEAQAFRPELLTAVEKETVRGTYDPASARERMDHAHSLAVSGRFAEALRVYRSVADAQKAAGVLAGEALWKVAMLEYGRGERHRLRAAATLDEIAEQAAIYGDPSLQARALIEAAILYQRHGKPNQARACLQRLQPLLQSPYLAAELREEIQSRIIRS